MFPFTRIPFWVHIFDPQPYVFKVPRVYRQGGPVSVEVVVFEGAEALASEDGAGRSE